MHQFKVIILCVLVCKVELCLLPTGGNPAAAWGETVFVSGWSPRGDWPSGPVPWCRRSADHQSNAGSLGPPMELTTQSQKTTSQSISESLAIQSILSGIISDTRLDILFDFTHCWTHWCWRGPTPSCTRTPLWWPSACRTAGTESSFARSAHTYWISASSDCMEEEESWKDTKKFNKVMVLGLSHIG